MSTQPDDWEELVNKPDKRFANEIPLVGRYWLLENGEPPMPETDLQALMEAEPNQEPRTSKEAQQFPIETVEEIVNKHLNDDERAVIETTIYAGHSLRKAGTILGMSKSTVQRIQKSALKRVKAFIEQGEQNAK